MPAGHSLPLAGCLCAAGLAGSSEMAAAAAASAWSLDPCKVGGGGVSRLNTAVEACVRVWLHGVLLVWLR